MLRILMTKWENVSCKAFFWTLSDESDDYVDLTAQRVDDEMLKYFL